MRPTSRFQSLCLASALLALPVAIFAQPQLAGVPQASAPPQPVSLLQQPPSPATVTYQGGQLTIHAENSSLRAILNTYASLSGTKISGLAKDERIFGVYGPGTPQEVLSSLLDDSDYNVVIAGRAGGGAPREISLSLQTSGGGMQQNQAMTQAAQADDDEEAPAGAPFGAFQDQPPAMTQPDPSPVVNPEQIRSPQQLLEELQRMRQRQAQQSGDGQQ